LPSPSGEGVSERDRRGRATKAAHPCVSDGVGLAQHYASDQRKRLVQGKLLKKLKLFEAFDDALGDDDALDLAGAFEDVKDLDVTIPHL
jgi:hypothetical protein